VAVPPRQYLLRVEKEATTNPQNHIHLKEGKFWLCSLLKTKAFSLPAAIKMTRCSNQRDSDISTNLTIINSIWTRRQKTKNTAQVTSRHLLFLLLLHQSRLIFTKVLFFNPGSNNIHKQKTVLHMIKQQRTLHVTSINSFSVGSSAPPV